MSFHMERPRRWEPRAGISRPGEGADHTIPPASDDPAQLDLLDELERARRARDRGHEVATWSTDIAWREAFDAAVARWANRGVEFVSDDVIAEVGPPVSASANVIGARMGAAARRGIIRRVGYRTSTKRSRNAGVVSVWRGA